MYKRFELVLVKLVCVDVQVPDIARYNFKEEYLAIKDKEDETQPYGIIRNKNADIDEILKTKDGITYRNLYEHLCSAQYIADSLQDDDANAILKIQERIGQKLLNEYNKFK